jgi:hypothetical protein
MYTVAPALKSTPALSHCALAAQQEPSTMSTARVTDFIMDFGKERSKIKRKARKAILAREKRETRKKAKRGKERRKGSGIQRELGG